MSALREALSRALARAPHADLGEHEARVLEALRGALALVGGPVAVLIDLDPEHELVWLWVDALSIGEHARHAARDVADAALCAASVLLEAIDALDPQRVGHAA